MGEAMIVLMILGGIALFILLWGILTYNRFVTLRAHIKDAWAGVSVELKRRYDLIPNLVETVKGYAAHERETLERVIAARTRAMGNEGPVDAQARDEKELRRRGLPRPQGGPPLPGTPGPAHRDRGPHRRRPALLQRQRPHHEHPHPGHPEQHRRPSLRLLPAALLRARGPRRTPGPAGPGLGRSASHQPRQARRDRRGQVPQRPFARN